jgi:hypothetical protein
LSQAILRTGLVAVITGIISTRIAHDSRTQSHDIRSLVACLDNVLALLEQKRYPLRDRCDLRSDLTGRSTIATKEPKHF